MNCKTGLKSTFACFLKPRFRLTKRRMSKMKYELSKKYETPYYMAKIMGPNPIKLEEELLKAQKIPQNAVVCDLGSGQGLTSVFLAKEYGFKVYATDLWSEPEKTANSFKARV